MQAAGVAMGIDLLRARIYSGLLAGDFMGLVDEEIVSEVLAEHGIPYMPRGDDSGDDDPDGDGPEDDDPEDDDPDDGPGGPDDGPEGPDNGPSDDLDDAPGGPDNGHGDDSGGGPSGPEPDDSPEPLGPDDLDATIAPGPDDRDRPAGACRPNDHGPDDPTDGPTADDPAQGQPQPRRPEAPSGRPRGRGRRPRTRRDSPAMRARIELRARLSTLLGLDDLPGEACGWGPLTADRVRAMIPVHTGGTWRWVITDDRGHLLAADLTRRRPTGWTRAQGWAEIEIAVPAALLRALNPADYPEWASLIHQMQARLAQLGAEIGTVTADGGSVLGSGRDDACARSGQRERGRRDPRRFADAGTARAVRTRDRRCRGPACRAPSTRPSSTTRASTPTAGPRGRRISEATATTTIS